MKLILVPHFKPSPFIPPSLPLPLSLPPSLPHSLPPSLLPSLPPSLTHSLTHSLRHSSLSKPRPPSLHHHLLWSAAEPQEHADGGNGFRGYRSEGLQGSQVQQLSTRAEDLPSHSPIPVPHDSQVRNRDCYPTSCDELIAGP